MATINDLGQSISEMTDEQLIARLRNIRLLRRTRTTSAKASKKPAKKINVTADLIKELERMMKT